MPIMGQLGNSEAAAGSLQKVHFSQGKQVGMAPDVCIAMLMAHAECPHSRTVQCMLTKGFIA